MNRLKLLVVLSVALNVGFITLLVLHAASTSDSRGLQSEHSFESSGVEPRASETRAGEAADGNDATSVTARAYRRLHNALREAGVPEDQARRILRGTALADLHDEMRQIRGELFPTAGFWKGDQTAFGTDSPRMVEFHRQMIGLRKAKEAALSGLVAEDHSLIAPWNLLYGQIHLPEVSEELRKAVMMLEEDYGLLRLEIEARTALGGALAEDLEALRLLEKERAGDLAALLSPEELEEYELRNSDTAKLLRHELRHFEATEEEFRAIFRIRHESETGFPAGFVQTGTAGPDRGLEAEQAMQSHLRELLGPDRFAEFQRSRNHEYQQLADLAARLDLPRESINQVYDFKTLIEHQEVTIQADSNLTEADRREAMQILAEEARRMVRESLGERGYHAYTAKDGWWIRRLDMDAPGDF